MPVEMKPAVAAHATHSDAVVRLYIDDAAWEMDPDTARGLARELEVCAGAAADYRKEHWA